MGEQAWKINVKVQQALTRNFIDVNQLKVNTVRDIVHIRGELKFTGVSVDVASDVIVINQLKKVDRELGSIPDVKVTKWDLKQWTRYKGKWIRKGIKHESKA